MSGSVIDNHTGLNLSVPSVTGAFIPSVETPVEIRNEDSNNQRVHDHLTDLSAIYPDPSDGLAPAMNVVSESMKACQKAIEAERKGDKLKADGLMLRAQALLPDMVAVRGIGEGFGIVTAALVFLFANQQGVPFSLVQIIALLRAYKSIWEAPFMSVDRAVAITDDLEETGLVVDPIPLTELYSQAEQDGFVDI